MKKSEIGRKAVEFAEYYIAMTEALMKRGVPEEIARDEARSAAVMIIIGDEPAAHGDCTLCGGTGKQP